MIPAIDPIPARILPGPARRLLLVAAACLLLAGPPSLPAQAQDSEDPPPAASTSGPEARNPIPAADFYGLNFIHPSTAWMALGRGSGAGTVRWQFNWRDHEPSPGSWTWELSDQQMAAWRAGGLRVHAILHNPPDWARANPGGLVPISFSGAWNQPDNTWGRFCHAFAQRYRGQIASYEVWNEPDLNQYWEGTAEQYFALLRSCYQAIKAADPAVPVAMAGMALLVERNFMPTVIRLAAEDPQGPANNYFFDAAAIHMYADPELVYSLTTYTRRVLNTYGLADKPIWITETNVALRGYGRFIDGDWGHVSEQEQAWYVLQAVSNAFAAGAERLMLFRLADDDMDEAFGLVRNDGSRRPSYTALQTASSLMYDIVEAWREVRGGVILTEMRRADGARIVSLYSKAGTALNIDVRAEQGAAILVNAAGEAEAIQARDGVYTLSLPPARGRDLTRAGEYAVGGPVLIVVEQDTQPPRAVAEVLPVPGDRERVVVRWSGDDGASGSGVAAYEVQVSLNGGPWETWGAGVTDLQTVYDISAGGSFSFRVRAVDRAGNLGEYSLPVTASLSPVGTLTLRITDLRGQPVPYARVSLSDGTLHDADAQGVVRITAPPGPLRVVRIDGSAQGALEPSASLEIRVEEEIASDWLLLPLQNLAQNGEFDFGSQGWWWSAPGDVAARRGGERGSVLALQGGRRPWGHPAAALTVDIPPGWSAGLLSFHYRLLEAGSTLRVRAATQEGQATLWQSSRPSASFARAWVDLADFEGQRVMIFFELAGEKGGVEGRAEIDSVIIGNVPVLP